MLQKYVVYVVPHTHWDREWYGSFQLFRLRLVRLVNKLLDLLDRDPEYKVFTLDGQTIVLEDYLEVHPEQRERLKRYIGEKRLMVGPWYILPDEFLVSGESYVRNLLLGGRMAREFGYCMQVGYIPDTFGHIGQLPQILLGFGLDTAMHFRGMDPGDLKSELWWESPDGSRVLLHHMSNIAGYTDSAVLAADWDEASNDLRAVALFKAQRATTNVLLAMQGVDHLEAREDLPGLVRHASVAVEEAYFVHASLEDFWSALKEAVANVPLDTVRGELRDVPRSHHGVNYLLYNVLSSRADNKLQNASTVIALENWAEPWCALAWVQGIAAYPQGHLWTAWRWLLQNHPHDSIGGCSVDAIHRQMATRFEWATEIADYLSEERFRLLARQLDLSAVHGDELALIVFNASPWERDEVISVDIDLPESWLLRQAGARVTPIIISAESPFRDVYHGRARQQWAGNPPLVPDPFFRGIHVRPVNGEDVPVQIESAESRPVAVALGSGPEGVVNVHRVRASFRARLPACGYATFAVRPDPLPNRWPAPVAPHNEMHNTYLGVRVHPNGAFDLTDRESGQTYSGLGLLEDGGDCGDGYTYSYPLFDRVYTTEGALPRISKVGRGVGVQRMRIEYGWELPVSLDERRRERRTETVVCPVQVDLILRDGSRRLEIEVTLDNRAKDHRLRMLFPTDLQDMDVAHSAMQFDVMTRPIAPQPIEPGEWWVEDPPVTFPQHGWMDMADEQGRGLAVLSQGIYEFAVLNTPRREIALTLLRAVGFLGARRDAMTIIQGAGPGFPTPEAQLLRQLTYRLALRPHPGAWHQDEVWRDALEFLTPPRAVTVEPHPGSRSVDSSWLRVEGRNAVLSAVKRAEDEDALVVRVYNPSLESTEARFTLPTKVGEAWLCDLQEHSLEPVSVPADNTVIVNVPPKKIVTVKLAFA